MSLALALLRGVNVGGNHVLRMDALRKIFEVAGAVGVANYLQSGNVVFDALDPAAIAGYVEAAIARDFAFAASILIRSAQEMRDVVANNPFAAVGVDENKLGVLFLRDAPSAQALARLDPVRSKPDEFFARGKTIYLHLPNGFARTKLTNAWFDRGLATISTARNWRVATHLTEMLAARAAQ